MNKFFFIFIVLLFSCNNSSVTNDSKLYKNLIVTFSEVKKFPLDTQTSPYIDCFQYIPSENKLIFLNQYNNSLYYYDYKTQDFISKTTYEKEGSNGVGALQGFLYQDNDSIYTYSYNTNTLCVLDSSKQVIRRKMMYIQPEVLGENFIIAPSPYVTTTTPIKKIGKFLIMTGFVSTETPLETPSNRPVICLYDTLNDVMEYVINYPKQYSESNWAGGFAYRLASYTTKDNHIIVSFPASNELVEYDIYSKSKNILYAGSGKVKTIKPYSEDKQVVVDEIKSWQWYMKTPSYESVLYDEFKKCYYRIVRLEDDNYQKGERGNNKPIVIVKLNEKLEYVGEAQIPMDKKWFSQKVFVTEKGLNMAFDSGDEDFISFQIFNIND